MGEMRIGPKWNKQGEVVVEDEQSESEDEDYDPNPYGEDYDEWGNVRLDALTRTWHTCHQTLA